MSIFLIFSRSVAKSSFLTLSIDTWPERQMRKNHYFSQELQGITDKAGRFFKDSCKQHPSVSHISRESIILLYCLQENEFLKVCLILFKKIVHFMHTC